jgi:hypothetical protein
MLDGFKKIIKMKTGGLVKTPVTNKKAAAPSKASQRAALKASDVEKEKSKPAGHKDPYIKSKSEKTEADAPSASKKGRNKGNGTVRKFKTGGSVENVYEAKKKAGDLDNIQKVKEIKSPKLCGGKSVKKMSDGRLTGPMSDVADLENLRMLQRAKNALKYLGPSQQAQFVQQGGMSPTGVAPTPAPAPAVQAPGGTSPVGAVPTQKRGGKVKKGCK